MGKLDKSLPGAPIHTAEPSLYIGRGQRFNYSSVIKLQDITQNASKATSYFLHYILETVSLILFSIIK